MHRVSRFCLLSFQEYFLSVWHDLFVNQTIKEIKLLHVQTLFKTSFGFLNRTKINQRPSLKSY